MADHPRPAPYPPDTRAKGWRFEIDHERIMQSDTWALTPSDVRPWLLMLWMVAWQQTPCGSLPDNSELIAARIGMPVDECYSKVKWLMRGWKQADDGRLYHDVITLRVLEMMAKRKSESDRKALARARKAATPAPPEPPPPDDDFDYEESRGTDDFPPQDDGFVPEMSHGTDAGLPGDSPRCPTPEPEPVPEPVIPGIKVAVVEHGKSARPTPAEVCKAMKSAGMAFVNPSSPKLIDALDSGVTKTELVTAAIDTVAIGKGFAYAIGMAVGRHNDAAAPPKPQIRPPPETFAERDARIGRARWEQMTGKTHPDNIGKEPPPPSGFVVDVSTKTLEFHQ